MKNRIISILSALIVMLLLALPVSADGADIGVSFNAPEGWSVLEPDNISDEENEELLEELGYTASSLKKYFSDNDLVLFAVSPARDRQIQLKASKTDFSKQIEDMTTLTDSGVANIAASIIDSDSSKWRISIISNMKFIETRSRVNSDDGNYCVVQFTTVRAGNLITLSYFAEGDKLTDELSLEAAEAAKGIKATSRSSSGGSGANVLAAIIIGILILLAIAAAVYILVTFFLDIHNKTTSDDNAVIRRRDK